MLKQKSTASNFELHGGFKNAGLNGYGISLVARIVLNFTDTSFYTK